VKLSLSFITRSDRRRLQPQYRSQIACDLRQSLEGSGKMSGLDFLRLFLLVRDTWQR